MPFCQLLQKSSLKYSQKALLEELSFSTLKKEQRFFQAAKLQLASKVELEM